MECHTASFLGDDKLNRKLSRISSGNGRMCSDNKKCCVHKCCNSQGDEQCCSTCEPLSMKVDWSNDEGFHVIEDES